MSIFIKNALLNGKKQNILIEDNLISYIGKDKQEADETINANKKAILPGLINTHTHSSMTLLRSYADDLPLMDWLQTKIWPAEAKLKPEHIRAGTKLACLEMIKSGTTCFNDMYFYPEEIAKTTSELGMRAVIGIPVIDIFPNPLVDSSEKAIISKIEELGKFGDLITPAIAPHAVYTVTKEKLKWIGDYSEENNLLVHTHLSETEQENKDCVKKYGKTPTQLLKDCNLLSSRLIAAHSVWLNEEDAKSLGNNKVTLAHCPAANMKLSVGHAFNFALTRSCGCNICLGTDGASSNNNLDMFNVMKMAALLQKYDYDNPTLMNASETFNLATRAGAQALRVNAGVIEKGKLADVILIDLKNPKLVPSHNLESSLVYSADSSCVETVIINGKIVMQNYKVEGEDRIVEEAEKSAMDLVK